jgi:hypothetical protein
MAASTSNGNGSSNNNARNGSTKMQTTKSQQSNEPDEPAPVAKAQLPLFEMSSQFKSANLGVYTALCSLLRLSCTSRNWRYSAESLAKARKDLNDTAVQRVRSMLQEELVGLHLAET